MGGIMKFDLKKICKKIEKSLKARGEYSKKEQQDIAFHMTDWLDTFSKLCRFYSHPEQYKPKDVEMVLMDFLYDAPHHIAAAKKLMTDEGVSDVFEIDAVNMDSNRGST